MNRIPTIRFGDAISATPRGIPSAPTNVQVRAISGECLEVQWMPPVYGAPLASYVVQWDRSDAFSQANGDSASCSSLEYGSCVLPDNAASNEVCGLQSSQTYFVRVFALNEVPAQLSGFYRLKFPSSEWTSFIPVNADATTIQKALEQLSTVGEVNVVQMS